MVLACQCQVQRAPLCLNTVHKKKKKICSLRSCWERCYIVLSVRYKSQEKQNLSDATSKLGSRSRSHACGQVTLPSLAGSAAALHAFVSCCICITIFRLSEIFRQNELQREKQCDWHLVNVGQLLHLYAWHQLRDKFKYLLVPRRTSFVSLWTRSPSLEPTHMHKTLTHAFLFHFSLPYPKYAMFNLFVLISGSGSGWFLASEMKLGGLSNEDDLRELLSQTLPYSEDIPVFTVHP